MSTRIWKLNNLERYGQLRKILLLPCREFHSPKSWMKWEIFSGLIVCSMLDLWRYEVHWPDRQDTLQTKQGDNSFCVSFKVGKPPINIVFFIYRVFNNGTYPIVFSINSYVSVYSLDAPLCTHCVHIVRRYDSSLEVSWTSSSGKRFPANCRWRVKLRLRYIFNNRKSLSWIKCWVYW